ncbi:right-handed parallel beta-helix repeat-containing protein [Methylomonas koyamae]|uniref:right-handed parallel beta-helix repeat-containing protein n=1 Tax=Methylomonas koyamae TaxID=702114 RepID=UPI0035710866
METASANIAYNNSDWGFEFSQPGAAAIVRNQSYNNRAGIHVSNSSAGIARIGDDDLAAGNGNLVYNNRDGGIYAYYGALVAGNTVYGHLTSGAWGIYGYSNVTTRSNVVYGNTQGIYAWFGSVETNRVYANSADGVRTENSDVVGNVIYSNAVGLRVGQNYNTPRTGRNNLIYANSQAGALLSGDRFTFINNTVVQPLGDALRVSDAATPACSITLSVRTPVIPSAWRPTAKSVSKPITTCSCRAAPAYSANGRASTGPT